jgi:hypothetical protein
MPCKSKRTTPVSPLTESTAPPPVALTIGFAGSVLSTVMLVPATTLSTTPDTVWVSFQSEGKTISARSVPGG